MKKSSKALFIILILSVVFSGIVEASPVSRIEERKVLRLSGNNRSQTSIKVSQKVYKEGSDTAIISGYSGSPDALTGTLLVNSKDGPLLVASNRGLTEELKAEILRLKTKKVYILGGEKAVPRDMEIDLEEMGIVVERLEGGSRWETSVEIARKAENTSHVFLVLGRKTLENGEEDALADALAIGPVSAKEGKPILLTEKDRIPLATKKAMKDLKVNNVTIVGGELAIYPKVANELKKMGIEVDRLKGKNRWETAKNIAQEYFQDSNHATVANDSKDTDALVGGYLAVKEDAPILLTQADNLPDVTKNYLEENMDYVYVLGGESVVSKRVFTKIMNKAFKVSQANTGAPIKIEKPDLSGQSTHPDVLYIEEEWNGYKYWMAHTPYKDSNEKIENPSLSYSDDGINFNTLEGAINPIDSPKEGLNLAGHMSDTIWF